MKHNPALLLELARMLDRDSSGELIVVSEGAGVEWLAEQAAGDEDRHAPLAWAFSRSKRCPTCSAAPTCWWPFSKPTPAYSACRRRCSATCAPAGRCCWPCRRKTWPRKSSSNSGAGLVVEPTDLTGFCRAAKQLIDSPQLRQQCGEAARRYAETHFDIRRIGDQFEAILRGC